MLTVTLCDYKDIPRVYRGHVSNNGCGKIYANYLVIKYNDKILRVFSDAAEPEDATFHRDLSWIQNAILEAYELGRTDK